MPRGAQASLPACGAIPDEGRAGGPGGLQGKGGKPLLRPGTPGPLPPLHVLYVLVEGAVGKYPGPVVITVRPHFPSSFDKQHTGRYQSPDYYTID